MSTSPQENRVFVGVNLLTREVTQIARYPELVRDYLLEGVVAEDGTITVETDHSFNGEDAVSICLDPASQNIGVGWTFAKAETV